jgi:hypothetical protein
MFQRLEIRKPSEAPMLKGTIAGNAQPVTDAVKRACDYLRDRADPAVKPVGARRGAFESAAGKGPKASGHHR